VNPGTFLRQRIPNKDAETFFSDIQRTREDAKSALKRAKEHMKLWYDGNRKEEKFEPGQEVLLSLKDIQTDRPSKTLDYKHTGPFKVIKPIGTDAYQIDIPKNWKIHPVFHVSQLQRYHPDTMGHPKPRQVTLKVRAEQWDPQEITGEPMEKPGEIKYQVTWTDNTDLKGLKTHVTWEKRSRMEDDFPKTVLQWYFKRSQGTQSVPTMSRNETPQLEQVEQERSQSR
jgi:hypothetical protein